MEKIKPPRRPRQRRAAPKTTQVYTYRLAPSRSRSPFSAKYFRTHFQALASAERGLKTRRQPSASKTSAKENALTPRFCSNLTSLWQHFCTLRRTDDHS